jgi:periplasmic protein TonB
MKKIVLSASLLALCFAAKAQSSPENLTEIDKPAAPQKIVDTTPVPDKIITTIEVMPMYPGGQKEMQKFISENLHYPQKALRKGIQGRVITKFVIDKDGSITKGEVVRGIGGGCDEEALRLLNTMPKWKPGSQNGRPVKVYYTLPFTFKIHD